MVDYLIPFDKNALPYMRFTILYEMRQKKFEYYIQKLNQLKNHINEVLSDKTKILNDHYWTEQEQFGRREIFWQQESPWMKKIYDLPKIKSGLTTLSKFFTRPRFVDKLVGNADWMTVQQIVLFKTIISTYFSNNIRLFPVNLNMDFVYLQRHQHHERAFTSITRRFLKGTVNVLKSLLSGSGPFILKLLQQINTANENTIVGDITVADITGDIFSQIPDMTSRERKYLMEQLQMGDGLNEMYKQNITNMNRNTLGSASIAEAHESYFTDGNNTTQTIVKFIKPMYVYYFLCECDFLLKVSWTKLREFARKIIETPKRKTKNTTTTTATTTTTEEHIDILTIQCRQLLMFFVREFIKEFDYAQEYHNTLLGEKYYVYKNIRSVHAFAYDITTFPVLILQRVPGLTMDKILRNPETPSNRVRMQRIHVLVRDLIVLWFRVALFSSGFFHADLHPGNIIWDEKNNILYIIDFGSCGQLPAHQRTQLIDAMFTSGRFKRMPQTGAPSKLYTERHKHNLSIARSFVREILALCEVQQDLDQKQQSTVQYLSKMILAEAYRTGNLYFSSLFLNIVEYSEDVGTCASNDILMFGRALAYLGNMAFLVEEICDNEEICPPWDAEQAIKSNIFRYPSRILKYLLKRH